MSRIHPSARPTIDRIGGIHAVAFVLALIGALLLTGWPAPAGAAAAPSQARVKGLPASVPPQDPRAFPGSSAAAVRLQTAQCVVPQKLGVVYLIDDSGSMAGADYDKLRASAVELGMQEVGATGVVAGIRFSDAATTIFGATDLAASPAPSVDTIRGALKSSGGTGYTNAFAAAKAQLAAFPATVDQKVVVLLSDGEPTDAFNAATEIPALGARVYPIGFGSADSAALGQIAALSGGVNQAVASDQSTQGAISRAVAAARCQPVDVPETFDLAPGQSRRVPFTVPANLPSFSAIATWGKGALDVSLVRPDGSVMAVGATAPTEQLAVTASTARAAVTAPPAGTWTVVLTARQENVRAIKVSIDVIGGGTQQHPMETQPGPSGANCTTTFTVNGRVAWSPCFEAMKGGVRSTVPIRIAGLDIAPAEGKDIRIYSSGRLESGNATVSIFARTALVSGSVPLYGGPLVLPLKRSFLFKGDAKSSIPVTHPNRSIAALPIRKEPGFELEWTTTGAKLTLSLDVSRQFEIVLPPKGVDKELYRHKLQRGYGLEVTLATSNEKGIAIDSVSGQIDEAKVFGGKLSLKNIYLSFDASDGVLEGGGSVELFKGPLAKYAIPSINASVGLKLNPFDFAKFEASVTNINKPIGPYVYLQKVGGAVSKLPAPWSVEGSTELTLGPKIDLPFFGEQSVMSIAGSAKWEYPSKISGETDVKILGQGASRSTFSANLDGPEASLSTKVDLSFGGTGMEGSLDGWLKKGSFQLAGEAKMKVFGKNVNGAEAFVGTLGAGACRRGWGPDYGWRLNWAKKAVKVMATSCDFGDLDQLAKPAQVGGAQSIDIGKDNRGELLQIVGSGGQPLGTVRGPDGTAVEIGTDLGAIETPKVAAIPDESTNSVWVVLNAPAPGAWVVEPRGATAPFTIAGKAKAKPQAQVKGNLRRSGGGLRLSYSVKRAAGEKLTLVERGPTGRVRQLLDTSKTKGVVRFSRMEGVAGERVIEASVRNKEGVRLRTILARYTATTTVRPGKVRSLKVRRSGSVARVSWKAPTGEKPSRYTVIFRTKDGRRIETSVSRTKAVFDGLKGKTSGKVSVLVTGPSGVESKAARATLPKKR